METYYTKKEYNEMKSILNRKLKTAEKKLIVVKEENKLLKTQINDLKQQIDNLENTFCITHVTED
mgnify:CR=1 FL=1